MIFDESFWDDEAKKLRALILQWMTEAIVAGTHTAADSLRDQIEIDWTLVNEDAKRFAETHSYDLVTRITNTSKQYLQTALSEWIESGEPFDVLVDKLTSSGMFGPVRAQMIASTEVTRAFAQGNLIVWRQSGVVEKKRWRTAVDELVCEICGPMEGKETDLYDTFHLPNGNTVDTPPAHVRCRCWVQPVVTVKE